MADPVNPSTAFNRFYENFMTELGLSFPGNASVDRVRTRFQEMELDDEAEPAKRMAKDIEPVMEALMGHDPAKADEMAQDAVIRRVGGTKGLLAGLELPATTDAAEIAKRALLTAEDSAAAEAALLQNKNGTIDYIRNLALTAIGLANMPPGVMAMISSMAGLFGEGEGDGAGGSNAQAADIMKMLGPMLGGLPGLGGL